MISAILALTLLAAAFGLVLGYAAIRFKVEGDPLVDQIDKILPQTQCGQCGFPGCKPYATAIAGGEAEINQCPPGGEDGVLKLAELLGHVGRLRGWTTHGNLEQHLVGLAADPQEHLQAMIIALYDRAAPPQAAASHARVVAR